MFDNWKIYLFLDEANDDYCGKHQVKRVKMTSKLGDETIGKGYVCPRCYSDLSEYCQIILRKDNKWIPIKEYT